MGLASFLFGGSKTADKAIEGVTNGIDKMFHTDEEKADNKQLITETKIGFFKAILSTDNDVRSKARRTIAQQFTQVFLTLVLGSAICIIFDLTEKAEALRALAGDIFPLVSLIVGFYFLGYYIPKTLKKKEQK